MICEGLKGNSTLLELNLGSDGVFLFVCVRE